MLSETERSAKIQTRGTVLASIIAGIFYLVVAIIGALGYRNLNYSNNILTNDNEKLLSQVEQISLELDNVKNDFEKIKQQVKALEIATDIQSSGIPDNSIEAEASKTDEKTKGKVEPRKVQSLSQLAYTDFVYSDSKGKWDVPTVENIGDNNKNKETFMSAVKIKLNYVEKIYPEDGDVQQMTLSYDVNNKYSKLSFSLYTKDSGYNLPSTITVCDNNGNVLDTINGLTQNSPTAFKEILLENVDTLKFVITSPVPYRDYTGYYCWREFYFGDAILK